MTDKLLLICGPTASGKTALAIECAKRLNSEVVSADSLYVYKGLNIGTAKPFENEKEGVVHHLIDVATPIKNFTVSDYKSLAEPIIYALQKNGVIPVVCGGTGFYINSLLYDLSYGNGQANLEVREKYKNLAIKYGNHYVYEILKEKDLETANKLHFNDLKRVIRALEICESGQKKSEIVDDFTPKHKYYAYAVNYPRDVLYERIDKRVDKMFEMGLIDEVKGLLSNGVSFDSQSMQGIGYKELRGYFSGEQTLSQVKDLIKLNTRHYAKRQITYFKKLDGLKWLEIDSVEKLATTIVKEISEND